METIYKIAKETGIPDEHVVNAWKLLRQDKAFDPKDVLDGDKLHPNPRGQHMIAKEFFT